MPRLILTHSFSLFCALVQLPWFSRISLFVFTLYTMSGRNLLPSWLCTHVRFLDSYIFFKEEELQSIEGLQLDP